MHSDDRINYSVSSEDIIARMKANLKNPPNKIEGSFASDNIQAVAREIEKYYGYVDFLQAMHYAETSEGEFLDKKAKEVGVFRKEPTKAKGYVTFEGQANTYIPKGFRVGSDSFFYVTIESGTIDQEGKITLPAEAVVAGSESNISADTIYKFDNGINGLRKAYNSEGIENGTDLEDDDHLRERTLIKMRYPGTSGNKFHYMQWAMEVEGVGRVKVFPLWNGAGTVKVSILDSNQKVANKNLIEKVQKHIDNGGERNGESLAPIGALLTVTTATEKLINVNAKVILDTNSTLDKVALADELKEKLQDYLDKNISYKLNRLTIAKIIDILYSIEGVADITEITANNVSDSIILNDEEIPTIESVVII